MTSSHTKGGPPTAVLTNTTHSSVAPRIVVRASIPQDAPAVARYMQDLEVFGNLLQLPHPTEELWVKRFSQEMPESFRVTALVNDEVAGCAGLFAVTQGPRRRHMMNLGCSVAKPFWRMGVANAMMTELLNFADNWAQVTRIQLEVFSDNVAAIKLYEKFGFVIEGTHRFDSYRNGRYADSHFMARLKPGHVFNPS